MAHLHSNFQNINAYVVDQSTENEICNTLRLFIKYNFRVLFFSSLFLDCLYKYFQRIELKSLLICFTKIYCTVIHNFFFCWSNFCCERGSNVSKQTNKLQNN